MTCGTANLVPNSHAYIFKKLAMANVQKILHIWTNNLSWERGPTCRWLLVFLFLIWNSTWPYRLDSLFIKSQFNLSVSSICSLSNPTRFQERKKRSYSCPIYKLFYLLIPFSQVVKLDIPLWGLCWICKEYKFTPVRKWKDYIGIYIYICIYETTSLLIWGILEKLKVKSWKLYQSR